MIRGRRFVALATLVAAALFVAAPASAQPAERPFHLGFTPMPPIWSPFGKAVAYSYLQHESDLVSHSLQFGVPWQEAFVSSDWRTFPSSVLEVWGETITNDSLFIPQHARYLSITPISSAYDGLAESWGDAPLQPLSAPWNQLPFDSPAVKTAFLNYAIATVEFFHPTYLGIAVEANILLARRPWLWTAYKELNRYVHDELKARYPSLTVFVTIQYEHMLGTLYESGQLAAGLHDSYPTVLTSEVLDLMRGSDLLALSTYPYMASEARVSATYFDAALAVGAAAGRQLAIEQTGFTSTPVQVYYSLLQGDEAQQDSFLGLVLWTAYIHDFAFVINYLAVDYGLNYGDSPVSLTWAYTGLFRTDGTRKPAGATWKAFLNAPLRR